MNIFEKTEYKIFRTINDFCGRKRFNYVMGHEPQYGLANNSEPIIVSLTSYPARYNTIIPTLKSLLMQTHKPDKIIVWLDEEIQENIITDQMDTYREYGIEYRYTNENLMPHNKYFYAMQEYRNASIITVDDDLVYSEDLIESLVSAHIQWPKCICARRVHEMRFDSKGKILPYMEWGYEYRKQREPSDVLFPTGCGGVLYPPSILPLETFEADSIRKLCLRADDIWLKFMELRANVKTVWVPSDYVMPYEVRGSQTKALNTINTNAGGNDLYIKQLLLVYPELKDRLEKVYESIKSR